MVVQSEILKIKVSINVLLLLRFVLLFVHQTNLAKMFAEHNYSMRVRGGALACHIRSDLEWNSVPFQIKHIDPR